MATVHIEADTNASSGMHSHSTEGKRFNRVNTLARIHFPTPRHVQGHHMPHYVRVNRELNQVSLVPEEAMKRGRSEDDGNDDKEEEEEEEE